MISSLTPGAVAVDVEHGQVNRSLRVGDTGRVGRGKLAEEGRVVEQHQGSAGVTGGRLRIEKAK